MAYIPDNLLRIMRQGPLPALNFLHQYCALQQHGCVDNDGQVQPCMICLEPMHGTETSNLSSSDIQIERRDLLHNTLRSNNKCNHVFHTEFMTKYVSHGNTCPVCRCHWFDSAAEEERAWEIQAAFLALDTFDYTARTRAQKRMKIKIHAVVFTDMPSVVAHWLSTRPRLAETEKYRLCGRVARSAEGMELVNAVVAAFRERDGKRMRLKKLENDIVAGAFRVAAEKSGKDIVREDHMIFLKALVETVLGYYAYSQGLMNAQPSVWRKLLDWMRRR